MIDFIKTKTDATRWALLAILVAAFAFINWPFLTPLFLAAIFALGLNDFTAKVSAKLNLKRSTTVTLIMLLGLTIFWLPITLAIYRIIINISQPQTIQTEKIVSQIHNLKQIIVDILQKISSWTGVNLADPAQGMIENILKKAGDVIFNFSGQFLSELPSTLLSSFVFLITIMVLLNKSESIKTTVLKFSPLKTETTANLIAVLKGSCSVTLFSTLVIGLIQASIVGTGSLIFGEGDFWLVLTVTFFVSFIPVIGAAPVGFFLAILAFIGGRTGSGIGLMVVAMIAGTIDNVLKPFMVGKENNINPLLGFTCVVGAIIMLGLPGLLIGPVIMNIFVGLTPLLLKD